MAYDGMDISAAAYEWDHARQLMAIRLAEAAGHTDPGELSSDIYTRKYLLARPLLSAIDPDLPPAVLLIDELDRADEPFEAFLLELLADFQVTVPEFGTVRAKTLPAVVITSNRTREVHDAIRRRCLYHWVDYPDAARERAILAAKAPRVPEHLAAQVVAFVQKLRGSELFKLPGVAETIDWAQALTYLNQTELAPASVDETLGVLLKYQDDIAKCTRRGSSAAGGGRPAGRMSAQPSDWRTIITRETLRDGSLLAEARKRMPPGTLFRSDEEVQADLDARCALRAAAGGRGCLAVRLRLTDVESGAAFRGSPRRDRTRLASPLLPVAARRARLAGKPRPDAGAGSRGKLCWRAVPHCRGGGAQRAAACVAAGDVHRRLQFTLGHRADRGRPDPRGYLRRQSAA